MIDIALGGDNTCARKTDGTLWCWGKTIVAKLVTDPLPLPVHPCKRGQAHSAMPWYRLRLGTITSVHGEKMARSGAGGEMIWASSAMAPRCIHRHPYRLGPAFWAMMSRKSNSRIRSPMRVSETERSGAGDSM
ncbi:MAG: hypothetical protein IPM54_21095 [Polyangiaceae bacterium]|nr:hypothetical protein [Polyangiaceae bacterium]